MLASSARLHDSLRMLGLRAIFLTAFILPPPPPFALSLTGNASQVSDGAAAVLLARRDVAKKLGLKIVGKFVTCAYAGCAPRVMGCV